MGINNITDLSTLGHGPQTSLSYQYNPDTAQWEPSTGTNVYIDNATIAVDLEWPSDSVAVGGLNTNDVPVSGYIYGSDDGGGTKRLISTDSEGRIKVVQTDGSLLLCEPTQDTPGNLKATVTQAAAAPTPQSLNSFGANNTTISPTAVTLTNDYSSLSKHSYQVVATGLNSAGGSSWLNGKYVVSGAFKVEGSNDDGNTWVILESGQVTGHEGASWSTGVAYFDTWNFGRARASIVSADDIPVNSKDVLGKFAIFERHDP